MKTTVSKYEFTQAFVDYDRADSYSYAGLVALYEYFEEMEESGCGEVELDVIAICCEFTEYEDLEEFHGNYDKEDYPDLDTIRDHTQVIEIPNSDSFIIQDF